MRTDVPETLRKARQKLEGLRSKVASSERGELITLCDDLNKIEQRLRVWERREADMPHLASVDINRLVRERLIARGYPNMVPTSTAAIKSRPDRRWRRHHPEEAT